MQLAGTHLPAGVKVLVSFAGANREPRRWEEPDRFDIRRKAAGHMGYGTGVHNCVGQVIARMEGEAVLRALAGRIPVLAPDRGAPAAAHNSLRGLDTLPVAVEPG